MPPNNDTAPSAGKDHAYQNVLVVDDNPAIVAAIATRLMTRGWECLTALDGYDAMELMAKHRVDAVVTDLDMPYVDGFGILELAKSSNHCPASVMTGSPESAQRCARDHPGVPIFLKPFQSQQILDWLDSISTAQDPQAAA